MSSEQIKINNLETPKVINAQLQSRVDINKLLSKVRQEKQKENKLNIIFFTIVISIFLSVGFILAL